MIHRWAAKSEVPGEQAPHKTVVAPAAAQGEPPLGDRLRRLRLSHCAAAAVVGGGSRRDCAAPYQARDYVIM